MQFTFGGLVTVSQVKNNICAAVACKRVFMKTDTGGGRQFNFDFIFLNPDRIITGRGRLVLMFVNEEYTLLSKEGLPSIGISKMSP